MKHPEPRPVLPYGRQYVDEEDVEAVVEVLRSDWLTTGPAVDRFELELARYAGVAHARVLNSGTSALHAAFAAAGVSAGDVVVTTPLTFVATANAARYLGADVRLVDIDPATGIIDPAELADVLDERVRVVAPVDYAGHPADYDSIRRIVSGQTDATIVADAAHSFGARVGDRRVGQLADMTAISFHPVKPLTTGEGGAVLTDDPDAATSVERFRTHGIVRGDGLQRADEGPWYYEMQELGYNYRMTDLQAGLGRSQLRKLDGFLDRRRAIASCYRDALSDLDSLLLPTEEEGVTSGWHLFVVRVAGDASLRRPFFERLRSLGLGVQVHYVPVHYHPFWREYGFRRGQFPHAEDFYARAVSIPIFPAMSDADCERVVSTVRQVADDVLRSSRSS